MRTVLPSFQSSLHRLRIVRCFLVTLPFILAMLLGVVPSRTECQTPAHYRIQPDDFLRAPDSLKATTFSSLIRFLLDNQGNILVPDWKNARLLRFRETGDFMSSVTLKKTSKEDTLRRAFQVNLSPAGLTYAMEPAVTKRVLILDPSDAWKGELNYENKGFGIWDYAFVDEHRIAALVQEVTVFPDRKLQRRHSIAMVNLTNWSSVTVRVAAPRDGGDFSDDFTNIVSNKEGKFFFGIVSEKEYKIFAHDKTGETIKTITRNYVPILKKADELAQQSSRRHQAKLVAQKLRLEQFTSNTMDRYLFEINWLALDSFDNLWVFTGKGQNEDVVSVDLFNKDGDFKKSFLLENEKLASQRLAKFRIRGNYLYAIVGDSNELNEHVYRYKLPSGIWQ